MVESVTLENGMNVKLYESIYEYACGCSFDMWEDIHAYHDDWKFEIKEVTITSEDGVKTTPENPNLEETITVNGINYQYVNWGEKEVSYVKADSAFDSVYLVLLREGDKFVYSNAEVFKNLEDMEKFLDLIRV